MVKTSARLLSLLSLLQVRRDWTGPDLAERLGVSTRTVRNDVERLRSLGYPVDATPGVSGGYRLGAGADLPPLLLDDDEAVAVAVGLRTAANGTVAGIEETSVRALIKLEQVLPSRLRRRVNALQSYTVPLTGPAGPQVDPGLLTTIAAACRDHEGLRFDYRGYDGTSARRNVEPHRLAHGGRRWYLVAWDIDRADWRTFRVDRIELSTPNGPRFTPREAPEGDVATYVTKGVSTATWRYRARVRLHTSADSIDGWLRRAVQIEPVDEHTCIANIGSDNPQMLAAYVGMFGVDFEVLDSPELVEALRALSDRYQRAASTG